MQVIDGWLTGMKAELQSTVQFRKFLAIIYHLVAGLGYGQDDLATMLDHGFNKPATFILTRPHAVLFRTPRGPHSSLWWFRFDYWRMFASCNFQYDRRG